MCPTCPADHHILLQAGVERQTESEEKAGQNVAPFIGAGWVGVLKLVNVTYSKPGYIK